MRIALMMVMMFFLLITTAYPQSTLTTSTNYFPDKTSLFSIMYTNNKTGYYVKDLYTVSRKSTYNDNEEYTWSNVHQFSFYSSFWGFKLLGDYATNKINDKMNNNNELRANDFRVINGATCYDIINDRGACLSLFYAYQQTRYSNSIVSSSIVQNDFGISFDIFTSEYYSRTKSGLILTWALSSYQHEYQGLISDSIYIGSSEDGDMMFIDSSIKTKFISLKPGMYVYSDYSIWGFKIGFSSDMGIPYEATISTQMLFSYTGLLLFYIKPSSHLQFNFDLLYNSVEFDQSDEDTEGETVKHNIIIMKFGASLSL